MAIDKTKFVRGNNLAVSDFNFDDPSNTITVKTDALSSVGQAIAAAGGGGAVPDASATVTGLVNNTLLQELGGKDKNINGVRVGKGPGSYTSNTVLGFLVLNANTSGQFNTAIGRSALEVNTTGEGNTAIGAYSLDSNTTGNSNTAVGVALRDNTTGSDNTAVGSGAMLNSVDGEGNTAVGYQALSGLTTGFGNTAVGNSALSQLTSGIGNWAIGYSAGLSQTSGDGQGHLGNSFTTDIFAQVGITTLSDERFKNISARTVPLGLDFISYVGKNALLTFQFKSPDEGGASLGRVRYGVSAQKILEEEGNNPVLINNSNPDNLRYNEMDMVAVLIKAVSELKDEFDAYVATHP